jgi:hypothetical protein
LRRRVLLRVSCGTPEEKRRLQHTLLEHQQVILPTRYFRHLEETGAAHLVADDVSALKVPLLLRRML